MVKILFAWLILVNLLTYFVFWLDKRRAKAGHPRIRERELLLWALAGGTPGAILAVRRHHHKTRKLSFKLGLAGVLAAQIALIWLWLH